MRYIDMKIQTSGELRTEEGYGHCAELAARIYVFQPPGANVQRLTQTLADRLAPVVFDPIDGTRYYWALVREDYFDARVVELLGKRTQLVADLAALVPELQEGLTAASDRACVPDGENNGSERDGNKLCGEGGSDDAPQGGLQGDQG
jgi:hypothetical protein